LSADQLKKKGAPIENHIIPPLLAIIDGMAVLKNAPNPATALLFYDFALSEEGQKILRDEETVVVHKNLPHPLRNDDLIMVDPVKLLDNWDAWRANYDNIIINKTK
jgi:iron(III) transport system substrate-binding protein